MSNQQPAGGAAASSREPGAHSQAQTRGQLVWYCPSRWLLAHHDTKANIQTLSSHMCLADLNNEGENLLALVDFKRRQQQQQPQQADETKWSASRAPYECRIRVYRGQQLIYNHFLDDMPSCLLATSVTSSPNYAQARPASRARAGSGANSIRSSEQQEQQLPAPQALLTMTIMDDAYFYNRLKPSHKFSLEDDELILDSLVKSEIEAWQMVKQNRVDIEAMRELLNGLSLELGNQELTSHSLNFLALDSSEARKQYLIAWKFKRLQNGQGEHLMSMDTICCAAARLKFSSDITRSGDFGQTREQGNFLNNARWNRIIDLQKDGLVVGTEDRHLLIYELRSTGTATAASARSRLERHHRLPAVPDHILVERRSPANFDARANFKELTYKVLVSCRNCRIYALDQPYLMDDKLNPPAGSKFSELVALKCNVLEMSWCGLDDAQRSHDASGLPTSPNAPTWPLFVVACLDRRVYCFSSHQGQCKWVVEVELPITCLVCLPKLQIGTDESSLVGVASRANRIDFYVALSGRIVDSIYFNKDDYPQAAAYGRFGREDNCLCLVSHLGHLLIFILKRTAKFAHGQCLSSAAAYASDTLASCGQLLQQSLLQQASQPEASPTATSGGVPASKGSEQALKLDRPVSVPSAFALSKSTATTAADQMLESIMQLDHDCDQVTAKNALEAHISRPQLQIPAKGREFVDQILAQSRRSRATGRMFASQMVKLRDKIKLTMEQQSDGRSAPGGTADGASRVTLTRVTGLGNIYRVSLALRLSLEPFVGQFKQLFAQEQEQRWQIIVLIYPMTPISSTAQSMFQVKPFRLSLPVESDPDSASGVKTIFESSIDFKLYNKLGQANSLELNTGDTVEIQLQLLASHLSSRRETLIQRPLLVTSVNVPLGQQ